ncbi:hypothetical protein JYU14_03110 [Simkania negevensis]|uniref:Sodium:solute symporter n=1 Tax=Simkania negevensis TaxID=83561 RepID=A0ABS3AQP2_9BACT|nr:hypothetical protein [Simkania negevensis]
MDAIQLTEQRFTYLDWGVIVAYFVLVLLIGSFFSKRSKNDKSFFLADRAMPMWAVALSVIATALSAATFIGAPQEAYRSDLSYLILNIGGVIAVFIIAIFFIPVFFRLNTVTIYGFLEKRFGRGARLAAGIAFLFGRLLASGARLFIAALAISFLFFGSSIDSKQALIFTTFIVGGVGTLYTLSGGIKAVIWTDVLQITVVVGTVLLTIFLLLHTIPLSIGEIFSFLSNSRSSYGDGGKLSLVHTELNLSSPYTLWTGCFAIVFMNIASYGVDHDAIQRILTCKSWWRGSLSLIFSNFLSIVIVFLFMAVGLLLFVFSSPEVMGGAAAIFNDIDPVYPQFLIKYLPRGLSGLAVAGLFAVAMGSLDSAINAMASSFLTDVIRPLKAMRGKKTEEFGTGQLAPRLSVAAMGLALIAFALFSIFIYDPKQNTILGFALGAIAFAYAGLLGVFFTGLFTRRGNTKSVCIALVGGALTVLLVQPYMLPGWLGLVIAWPWWLVFGTTVSFTICCMGRPAASSSSLSSLSSLSSRLVLDSVASEQEESVEVGV